MAEYEVHGKFVIMDKSNGKTIERMSNTTYNSGNIVSDERRIVRKSLKAILADLGSLSIQKNE